MSLSHSILAEMFQENDNLYPAKPDFVQPEQGSRYTRLFISMFLFFLVFILWIPENYILGIEIIGILLLHELGHLSMMKLFGYKALNMFFIPFLGAMVTGSKTDVSQKQKIIISLMGPLPGIIIGSGLFLYAIYVQPGIYLVEISLLLIVINVLNLIPLDPLDGGNCIEALFFPSNDQFKMYFTLFSSIAIISIGVLFEFYPILIFGFLMAFKVRAFQKSKVIHDDLDSIDFNYKKKYADLSDREYWTMRRVFLENNPKIKEIIPDDEVIWENENLIIEQLNQLLRVDIKRDLTVLQRSLFFVLLLSALLFPVYLIVKNYHIITWYLENSGI